MSKLVIKLGDREFPLRRVGASWHLMKFADAQKKAARERPHTAAQDQAVYGKDCDRCVKVEREKQEAGLDLLLAMRNAVLVMLQPDVKDEFEEFMETAALEPQEFELAIGDAIAAVGSEPEAEAGKEEPLPSTSSESPQSPPESSPDVSPSPAE